MIVPLVNRSEAFSDQVPLSYTESGPDTAALTDFPTLLGNRADLPTVLANRARPAPWLTEILNKTDCLLTLEHNWDSYGAAPVDPTAVAWARELAKSLARVEGITEPSVGATPDGNVGFCWDTGDWSLDAEVITSGRINYVYLDERDHANDRDTSTRNPLELAVLLTGW